MFNPKISIIVPVYNSALYLGKCIDSLRFQTYDNLEIICVDDGSTDNSLEVLNNYAKLDERIVVIQSENKGAATARNIGIDVSTGEYLSFIDSDDWVLLTLYKTFVDYVQKSGCRCDIFCFNGALYCKSKNDIIPLMFFDISDWNNHISDYTVHTFNDCNKPLSSCLLYTSPSPRD